MIKTTALLCIFLVLISCDKGELSKNKAKKLIEKCESNPYLNDYSLLDLGRVNFRYDKKKKEKYDKLVAEGLLSMTGTGKKLEVSLSEKGKTYVTTKDVANDSDKFMGALFGKSKGAYVRLATYTIDEILEIQEIPQFNAANVRVKFKVEEKTPFFILGPDKDRNTFIKNLEFRKTTDGWKYCKNDQ
ncbi:hypothetical protein [Aquimarina latercula]|uniref:hypothetical protein n=1 Tax=Aquimarina latercula TaxID=987 RepID=UPI000688DD16|nr:hypothetical protein [Aquimarina latercula]